MGIINHQDYAYFEAGSTGSSNQSSKLGPIPAKSRLNAMQNSIAITQGGLYRSIEPSPATRKSIDTYYRRSLLSGELVLQAPCRAPAPVQDL